MKTMYLKIAAACLVLSLTSCDGCKEKKTTESNELNTTVNDADGSSAYDQASEINDGSKADRNVNAANGSGKTKSANTTNGGKKRSNGYSAADGTDAENNDGDMYTKHDTTPQASGPPIK